MGRRSGELGRTLAGGGVKAGHSHGATDDIGYAQVEGAVHVHDLHDDERVTFRFQGRDYRLMDVHGRVVREILA